MSSSSAIFRAPGVLVGAKNGKGVYATRRCTPTSSRSSRPSSSATTTVCECPAAPYGAPRQYRLLLPPVGNGTCAQCQPMGGAELLLDYLGVVDSECVWRSQPLTNGCDSMAYYWYLKQSGATAKIMSSGWLNPGQPEWTGANRFHGAVTCQLSTDSDKCVLPKTLVAYPVADVIANHCAPLAPFMEGVVVGAKNGKPVYAAGKCQFGSSHSSASNGLKPIPPNTKNTAWLVGQKSNKPVYAVLCCDQRRSSSSSAGPPPPAPQDCYCFAGVFPDLYITLFDYYDPPGPFQTACPCFAVNFTLAYQGLQPPDGGYYGTSYHLWYGTYTIPGGTVGCPTTDGSDLTIGFSIGCVGPNYTPFMAYKVDVDKWSVGSGGVGCWNITGSTGWSSIGAFNITCAPFTITSNGLTTWGLAPCCDNQIAWFITE